MPRKILAVWLAVLLMAPGLIAGQRTSTDKEVAKIKKRVSQYFNEGAWAIVEMHDGRKLQGSISEISENQFVVVDGVRDTSLAYRDVKKVKRQGPSLKTKRAVALGIVGGLLALAIFGATHTR